MKKCSKCGDQKPFDEFSPSSKTKDGVRSQCKKCAASAQSARRNARKLNQDYVECVEKVCPGCKTLKLATEFQSNTSAPDRLQTYCSECQNRRTYDRLQELRRRRSIDVVTHKTCSNCEVEKPAEDFYKYAGNLDGLTSRCIECSVQISHEWRTVNPDLNRKKARDWVVNNPERAKETARKYAQENREYFAFKAQERKARKLKNGVFEIRKSFMIELYETPCVACGSTERIEADHIIPLSRGGEHSEDNLQPLCKRCNLSKGTKLMSEWIGNAKAE